MSHLDRALRMLKVETAKGVSYRRLLFKWDGETESLNRLPFPLAEFGELYHLLDTIMVELVYIPRFDDGNWLMLVDEDGKGRRPPNLLASAIARGSIQHTDYIAGNAAVLRVGDLS